MRAAIASPANLYRRERRDVPEAPRLYDSLGRFRGALLVREWNSTRDSAIRMRLQRVERPVRGNEKCVTTILVEAKKNRAG